MLLFVLSSILDIIVWLSPISFVFIIFFKILSEKGNIIKFLNLFLSLIIMIMAIVLKNFFIFVFKGDPFPLIFPDFIYLISLILLFPVLKEIREVQDLKIKFTRKIFIPFLFCIFFPLLLFLIGKNWTYYVELFIYSLATILFIIIILNTEDISKSFNIQAKKAVSFLVFALILDLFLKSIAFLKGLTGEAYIALKTVRFSIRGVASVFLIYILSKALLSFKEIGFAKIYKDKLISFRKKYLNKLAIFIVFVSIILAVTILSITAGAYYYILTGKVKELKIVINLPLYLLIFLSAIIFLLVFSFYVIKLYLSFDDAVITGANLRTEDIIGQREEIQRINKQLVTILNSISNIRPEEELKQMFSQLLLLGLTLEPKAQAGAITFKQNGFYKFVAFYGYKAEYIEKIAFSENEIIKVGKPTIIKHLHEEINIKKKKLSEENLKNLELAGSGVLKSTLMAPLFLDNKFIGNITLDSLIDSEAFSTSDLKVMDFLSKLGSLIIEYKIFFENLEKRRIEQDFLISIFKKGSIEASLEQLLKTVYSYILRIFPDISNINASFYEKQKVKIFACSKKFVEDKNFLTFADKGISGRAFRKRKSQIVFDVSEDKDYLPIDSTTKSQISVPVFIGIEPLGVVSYEFSKSDAFKEENEAFFNELSNNILVVYKSSSTISDLKIAYLETILALVKALELKDPYTRGHSERVTILSLLLAEYLELPQNILRNLLYTGLLHDIGKIGIEGYILNKDGKLTEEEYEHVKRHPAIGEEFIKDVSYLGFTSDLIRHHHERYNGEGYPDKLKKEDIPLESRIISLCDAYDAMQTDRPYRKGHSHSAIINELIFQSGKQFDPNLVSVFLEIPQKQIEEELRKNILEKIKGIF